MQGAMQKEEEKLKGQRTEENKQSWPKIGAKGEQEGMGNKVPGQLEEFI